MASPVLLHAIAAAVGVTLAAPAAASVIVIGSNAARMCYEAADSSLYPTPEIVGRCDEALQDGSLDMHDIAATHVNRGILRLRRGQIDRAIADFDRAMQIDPDQPEAYLNKGAALLRQGGEDATAARLFTIAIEHNTLRPAIAHFGRAVANEGLGNVRAAYDDYRTASELDPRWQLPRAELQRFRIVSR